MLSISVVMPCCNGEAFLAEALASINVQTRPPLEVIVVDDGSTDRSGEIAAAHGAVVLRQPNLGEGAARNRGIRAAKGELIASLDADDRWRPHHLETVGSLLEAHPTAVGAFGAVQRFGSRTELIVGYVPPGPPATVLEAAFADWLHTTIGALLRRDALLDIGGFDEQERYGVDFDLWLRLAKDHLFVATHEVTADWRMHGAQQSASLSKQLATVYRSRRRFINGLRSDRDPRADALEHLFTRVWRRELRESWERRDRATMLALATSVRSVRPMAGSRRTR